MLLIITLLLLLLQPLRTLVQHGLGHENHLNQIVSTECNSTIEDDMAGEPIGISSLFGEPDPLESGQVIASSSDPKAVQKPPPISLSLKGIIGVNGENGALAILNITGGSGADAVFGAGDQLPGAAILKEIHFDRVVISRSGLESVLFLGDDNHQEQVQPKSIKSSEKPKPASRKVVRSEPYRREIPRILLASKLANPAKLMAEITIQLHKKDGVQQGYRLTSVRGSSLLRKLGLNSGDIITEINDVKLDNLGHSLNALNQIKNAEVLRVSALRRGKNKSFVYTINN